MTPQNRDQNGFSSICDILYYVIILKTRKF